MTPCTVWNSPLLALPHVLSNLYIKFLLNLFLCYIKYTVIQELFQDQEDGQWLINKIGITGYYEHGYADLIQDREHGFELLDDLQLGSTDFKNQLTKQRIFQGELIRSIERINGVAKARVQIAEPERSVFADKDEAFEVIKHMSTDAEFANILMYGKEGSTYEIEEG